MLPEAGHNILVLWLNALILVNAHGTPVKRVWFTGCLLKQCFIATRVHNPLSLILRNM